MIPAGSRARIPLIVAANGPQTMRIAAGADGWATTGPESTDASTEQWWDAVAGSGRPLRGDRRRRPAGTRPSWTGT